jgi:hypothetical protein
LQRVVLANKKVFGLTSFETRAKMLIKYGCELSIAIDCPTPTFCLVDIHPERRADIVSETSLTLHPLTAVSDELDAFGNRLGAFSRRWARPATPFRRDQGFRLA